MHKLEEKYWREWIQRAREYGSSNSEFLAKELATIADDEQRDDN